MGFGVGGNLWGVDEFFLRKLLGDFCGGVIYSGM